MKLRIHFHHILVSFLAACCLISSIGAKVIYGAPASYKKIDSHKENTGPDKSSNSPLKSKEIDPGQFGAKGDGITDDTVALQKALELCSLNGLVCKIPGNKKFLVTNPLYIWGNAGLRGEGNTSTIIFDVHDAKYLLNLGISGPHKLEKPFAGKISDLRFKMKGGKSGRIIFFWRSDGAQILDNVFDIGSFSYSATSSGNDQRWVPNGFKNCIRKNVIIRGNIITASAANIGSEGIGLGNFDGALIENNKITGVGDDPIAIHFSENVKILNNDMKSVDGRIYVSNSKKIEIAHNRHERARSVQDGKFYRGIALLYVGFETLNENDFAAPTDIKIHHNTLLYPEGSIDHGGAIYLYGPRNVSVEYNRVINNASAVKAAGLRLLPANFTGRWRDPDRIDPAHVARVWNLNVSGNTMEGKYPLPMLMTGNCLDYRGDVLIRENSAANFDFYCGKVKLIRNIKKK